MTQAYEKRYFEYFIIAIIIACITLMALNRYTLIAKDARILRLQIISQNFMTGAANARAEYFLRGGDINKKERSSERYLLGGKNFYFSSAGWPLSTRPLGENYHPTDDDCHDLWQALLQDPEPVSLPFKQLPDAPIQVFAHILACRYQLKTGDAWFEYFPSDGKIHFSSVTSSNFH